ncbi:MAG: hypothetical protein ABIQ09_13165 [Jatrophihabitantaceae bacterium]
MAFRTRRSAIIACLAAFLAAATVTGCAEERPPAAEYRGVDFSQDEAANGAASQLGQRLLTSDLPSLSGYAGLQILRPGIQVDVVGDPTPEMRAVVARHALRYQGSEIPVTFRSVRYSEKELRAVASRISADQDGWAKRGIQLSSWGIDITSNTVEIMLVHYTKAYGTVLLERYGDRVTVYPHDYEVTTG